MLLVAGFTISKLPLRSFFERNKSDIQTLKASLFRRRSTGGEELVVEKSTKDLEKGDG